VRPRKNFGNIAEDRAFAKRLINVCRDSIRNVGGVLKSHFTEVSSQAPFSRFDFRQRFPQKVYVYYQTMLIRHLYISPGHNFFGHLRQPSGENPIIEVSEIYCVTARGIRGDRFFDYKNNYKGQITFLAAEVYSEVCLRLGVTDKEPAVLRRNVITEGADLNALIGVEFDVQGVRFRGQEECSPCYWMDAAVAPGAKMLLKGRGGLRAVILTDGKLCTQSR